MAWIPDKEQGFVPGEILSSAGGVTNVRSEKGEVTWLFFVFLFFHFEEHFTNVFRFLKKNYRSSSSRKTKFTP